MANSNTHLVVVGKFASAFGVRGWIKVHASTRPAANILDYQPWQIHYQGQWLPITLTDTKISNEQISVKIQGCDDRDQAKLYTNCEIAIERDQLPPPDDGQHYWHDLEGLTVVNHHSITLGIVDHLFETGANDVLVVMDGEKKRLIPYIVQVVTNVDLETKCITVDWEEDY